VVERMRSAMNKMLVVVEKMRVVVEKMRSAMKKMSVVVEKRHDESVEPFELIL
jgi:hypothetical protein